VDPFNRRDPIFRPSTWVSVDASKRSKSVASVSISSKIAQRQKLAPLSYVEELSNSLPRLSVLFMMLL